MEAENGIRRKKTQHSIIARKGKEWKEVEQKQMTYIFKW